MLKNFHDKFLLLIKEFLKFILLLIFVLIMLERTTLKYPAPYIFVLVSMLLSIFYFSFGTNILVNSLSDFYANMFFYLHHVCKQTFFSVFSSPHPEKLIIVCLLF